MKVIIIGGVAGGASAAARLRRLDEHAEIIMLERDEYISFANCGLPYYISGTISERGALALQTPESFKARFNVDVRVFSEVVSIDRDSKKVVIKKVKTGEIYEETYDKLILAPGAAPFSPKIEGIDLPGVFRLRNIPNTLAIEEYINKQNPKTAVVIGCGYIGMEMMENLHEKGIDVTMLEVAKHIIASLDFEMAADVQQHMRKKGIDFVMGEIPQSITKNEDGYKVSTDKGTQIIADMVVLSAGVVPETKLAKDAGLDITPINSIAVDAHMRTSDPDIYAAGDAVGVKHFVSGQLSNIPLAGPANKQGRIAADNICGIKSTYKNTQGSSILKAFDLTVASTGLNERTIKTLDINYDKVFLYPLSHASYYPGATNMQMKVLFDTDTHKILGAQIVGYGGVDKRCDVLATSIRLGATIEDLTELELCYAPPFSSAKDPVNMAGYIMENVVEGRLKQFFWDDVDKLARDGSLNLLDVRTPEEYERSHIDGFINIPIDELRTRIDELDSSKPTYVHCRVGARSYIACRILSAHGFDCSSLSGGYRLYYVAKSEQER